MQRYLLPAITAAFLLLFGSAQAASVRVADGDCAGLTAALNAPGDKSVLLAARGNYRACALSVSGSADLDAAGARLGRLYVAASGRLRVDNARIGADGAAVPVAVKGTGLSPSLLPAGSASFLINEGDLTLRACSLSGIDYGVLRSVDSPLLNNSGRLTLRNVTIAGNRAYNGAGLIGSSGSLEVLQSTLVGGAAGEQPFAPVLVGGIGALSIGNSVLSAPGMQACYGAVASLGGNVFGDASCNATAADRIGDAQLGERGLHGGLVETLALSPQSNAIDLGQPALCEAADARGAARAAAPGRRCDAGAYEFGGGSGLLAGGGINGTFYNAASDGHYVMIQRLDQRLALVTWSTFDARGAAALIYGVGEVDGGHIHVAQAARNAGGVMQADGVPRGQHADAWGVIDIDLSACSGGSFAYRASAPGFASGRFALSRLVGVDDVQCSE
jgi:hypothetical protein